MLLDAIERCKPPRELWRAAQGVLEVMAHDGGPYPNIDFALGVLGEATRMVHGAGETIFAVARSAGWIAHGLEEYPHRLRYRIRATYTGPDPRSVELAGAALLLAAVVEEVDEHVVAEGLGRGEERPAPVHLHHPLDEVAQVGALVEHERVDADAVAWCSAAPRCSVSSIVLRRRRVLEERPRRARCGRSARRR